MSVTFNLKNFDVKKETQKEHTFIVDGLINGGGELISGIIHWFENGWPGLYPGGGLKSGILR